MLNLSELKSEVDKFCNAYLPDEIEVYKFGKVIHDTTWGTNYFENYEISIINTPIFQRLRFINQMGFVSYVYPSARHSRFEHSLGVAILSKKMFEYSRKPEEHFLSDKDLISIRLSAILHDVGHCLYSHTSELVYAEILNGYITEEFKELEVDPSPHEFFSYLIITSNSFCKYFEKLSRCYKLDIDPYDIALKVIGGVKSESHRFITSFINGPFDADKIDYFHRDSQFSGIPIQLDLDRLFYELAISDLSELSDDGIDIAVNDLTVGLSGVACIEQIIFNKMLLYSTIYNHHKVQAMDCMFKGIFEYIKREKKHFLINDVEIDFNKPTDFLYLVDYDLFTFINDTDDQILKKLIKNILERKLLKRALIINRSTIKNGNIINILSTKANRTEKNKYLRELAKKIYEDAKVDCDLSEIWIDIPKIPSFKEASMTYIRANRSNQENNFKPISDFYPYTQFKELYELHKLNGHVFAPNYCLKEIAESAKKIFKEELNVSFNDKAFIY